MLAAETAMALRTQNLELPNLLTPVRYALLRRKDAKGTLNGVQGSGFRVQGGFCEGDLFDRAIYRCLS